MNNKEILNNNKLIAESPFAEEGTKNNLQHYIDCGNQLGYDEYLGAIKYKDSWNCIMPIWFNIQKWGKREFGVYWEQSIGETFVIISTTKADKFKLLWLNDGEVKDVHFVVIQFLKWYNSQNK